MQPIHILDLDNTYGYGPEHYYATEGSTLPGSTNLYGTYQIRVQYYSDKSDARYTPNHHMAPKREIPSIQKSQTGQEFWVEESRSGVLSTPSNSDTGNFQDSVHHGQTSGQ